MTRVWKHALALLQSTVLEPQGGQVWKLINHYLNHELSRFLKSTRNANKRYIKNWIEPGWHGHLACGMKTMQIQEWLGKIQRPEWNQAEDQDCDVDDLFARGPLGVGGTQSSLRPRRERQPSWCFNGRSPKHRVSIRRVVLVPDVVRQTLE